MFVASPDDHSHEGHQEPVEHEVAAAWRAPWQGGCWRSSGPARSVWRAGWAIWMLRLLGTDRRPRCCIWREPSRSTRGSRRSSCGTTAGLRSLGPVWSRSNAFGHGVPFVSPSSPDIGPGLTDGGFGARAPVRRAGHPGRRQPFERGGLLGPGGLELGPDRGQPFGRARAVCGLAQPDRPPARRDRGVGWAGRDRVRLLVPAARFRR